MNTPSSAPSSNLHNSPRRALVLGGGGSAGNAWLIGIIAGLVDAGVDTTDADLIIGTSAGATAAAQITGASVAQLLAAIVTPPASQQAGPGGHGAGTTPAVDALQITNRIISEATDPAGMRLGIGAAALELDAGTDGSAQARRRAIVAARLPRQDWPDRRILITAVDAVTGVPIVFDRDSGVDLADAVAASTAVGFGVPPHRIGDHSYIDGGYRRNENADLAAGCERVLVLSPLGGRTRHPLEWGMQLAAQVDELRAGGSDVVTIVPDHASLAAFGTNMMNPGSRPPAARAGYDQGRAIAGSLSGFWADRRQQIMMAEGRNLTQPEG